MYLKDYRIDCYITNISCSNEMTYSMNPSTVQDFNSELSCSLHCKELTD